MTPTAFGLDLAGYSTGKSSLARIDDLGDGRAKATLLTATPFKRKVMGNSNLATVSEAEVALMRKCMELGPVAVDVPIDLQDLLSEKEPRWVWQLTKRPVDKAFSALSPLADRIGTFVARFRNIMEKLDCHSATLHPVLETYPAGTLHLMGLPDGGYKGTSKAKYEAKSFIRYEGDKWMPGNAASASQTLAELSNSFRMSSAPGVSLDDDDFDAIICSLAAIAGPPAALAEQRLAGEIQERLGVQGFEVDGTFCVPPAGYTLAAGNPFDVIEVSFADVASDVSVRASQ